MSYTCEGCQKGYQRGHSVSHAKNRTIRRFRPNLHFSRVVEGGSVVRRLLCSRCLRKTVRPTKKKTVSTMKQPLFAPAS